jgi:hypothetical protein
MTKMAGSETFQMSIDWPSKHRRHQNGGFGRNPSKVAALVSDRVTQLWSRAVKSGHRHPGHDPGG